MSNHSVNFDSELVLSTGDGDGVGSLGFEELKGFDGVVGAVSREGRLSLGFQSFIGAIGVYFRRQPEEFSSLVLDELVESAAEVESGSVLTNEFDASRENP